MDEIKIRELSVKHALNLTDLMIVEDDDGTKVAPVSVFKSILEKTLYCDTILDLKKGTYSDGDVITTLGYNTINDGGAATYIIDYDPTALDDGARCHYLKTSDTLRAKLIYGKVVNAIVFGVIGDGETDDYARLQAAIDASTDCELYIPKRSYKLSAPLKLASNTRIDFNGSTLISNNSSAIRIGLDTDAYNISISNLNITGYSGIEVYTNAGNILISNVLFLGVESARDAISLHTNANITITDCTILNALNGITIASSSIVFGDGIIISNCNISTISYGIYSIGPDNSFTIKISNNIIGRYGEGTLTAGIYIASPDSNVLISGCTISDAVNAICTSGILSELLLSITDLTSFGCTSAICINSSNVLCHVNGSLTVIKKSSETVAYVFGTMNGTIYYAASGIFTDAEMYLIGTISGKVFDRSVINYYDKLNISTSGNIVLSTVLTTAIDYTGASALTTIEGGASGQIIALYCSTTPYVTVASDNVSICLKDRVNGTLNRYSPMVLQNLDGVWTEIR